MITLIFQDNLIALKISDQRMDIHLMMCPETDTVNKSKTIPKYLGIHAALKVFKKIEKKKSYCLDIFIFSRDQ